MKARVRRPSGARLRAAMLRRLRECVAVALDRAVDRLPAEAETVNAGEEKLMNRLDGRA